MTKAQIIFGVLLGAAVAAHYVGLLSLPDLLVFIINTFFLAIWLFTGGIHAKGMYERGKLDGFLKWAYAPLVVVVIVLDVVFNVIYGTVIYRETPREWLFTTRTKRHLNNSIGHQFEAAKRWAYRLNAIDPGHV